MTIPNAASASEDAPYYFLHIPKTAGSSLNAFLFERIRKHLPAWGWHQVLDIPARELADYQLYSGHYYAYFHKLVPAPLRYFTFLRNPVERALSHYGHVLRDQHHYFHQKATELGSFGAYLRDPETQQTICNFQAKALTQQLDPRAIADSLSPEDIAHYRLERILETTPSPLTPEQMLASAKQNLDSFCFVGLTERFSDSVELLCHTFGWHHPGKLAAQNVNSERTTTSSLPAEDLALLEELNAVDIALYEYAKTLFLERFETAKLKDPDFSVFVSYAQNGEDVMLHRAFVDKGPGTYVDVGAQDPMLDSVTKAFYERGWRGINIEPSNAYFARLQDDRPEDINIQQAVSDTPGEIAFYDVADSGLSTTDPRYAAKYRDQGFQVTETRVPCSTLSDILEKQDVAEIRFLKIDIEGAELAALKGLDLRKYRPWIILVEATEPNSRRETHQHWEHLLLEAGYAFAYFDGLNRFYLAEEHPELREAFTAPPNVFDKYRKYRDWKNDQELQGLKKTTAGLLWTGPGKLTKLSKKLARFLKSASHSENNKLD